MPMSLHHLSIASMFSGFIVHLLFQVFTVKPFQSRPPHKHIGTSRGIVKAAADVPVMDTKAVAGRPALQSPRRDSPFLAVHFLKCFSACSRAPSKICFA